MLECWHEEPSKRPSFAELRSRFDSMLMAEKTDTYIDLQIDASKPYYNPDPAMIATEDNFLNVNKLSPNPSKRMSATSPFHAMGISPSHTDFMELFSTPVRGQGSPRSISPAPGADKSSEDNPAGADAGGKKKKKQTNVYVEDPSTQLAPELQVVHRSPRERSPVTGTTEVAGYLSSHRPASLQLVSEQRNVYVDTPSGRRSVHFSPTGWTSSGYLTMDENGVMTGIPGQQAGGGARVGGVGGVVEGGANSMAGEGDDGTTLPEIIISLTLQNGN